MGAMTGLGHTRTIKHVRCRGNFPRKQPFRPFRSHRASALDAPELTRRPGAWPEPERQIPGAVRGAKPHRF
jgi:hypothetical protein